MLDKLISLYYSGDSRTKSSHLRSSLSLEWNLDKTMMSNLFLPHLTRNSSNLVMYYVTGWLLYVKRCYWSSTHCLYGTCKYFSVFLLEFQFHLIPSLNSFLMSESHQFLNIRPILFSLTYQFHFDKSNPSFVRHIILVKVVVHVRNPIKKNLEIQLTIESGCFKCHVLKVRSRKVILVVISRVARSSMKSIIINIVGSLSSPSVSQIFLHVVHPSG